MEDWWMLAKTYGDAHSTYKVLTKLITGHRPNPTHKCWPSHELIRRRGVHAQIVISKLVVFRGQLTITGCLIDQRNELKGTAGTFN